MVPQEQGMLGRAPEEVAKFLAKTSGLNKTMIGEYLGEREEACLRVMHAYVDAMDFGSIEFDTAIRSATVAPCRRHAHLHAVWSDGRSCYSILQAASALPPAKGLF